MATFKDFDKEFAGGLAGWKLLCTSTDFSLTGAKTPWPTERFNLLQRLVLVSVLRPDRFVEAVQQLIATGLGWARTRGRRFRIIAKVRAEAAGERGSKILERVQGFLKGKSCSCFI